MEAVFHYVIQTIIFQLFFLIVYDVFLKKHTFFVWNRLYLLITVILSVLLPFIRIESFKTIVSQDLVNTLPPILLGSPYEIAQNNLSEAATIQENTMDFSWQTLWYVGMVIAFVWFIYKLIRLSILIYKNTKRWKGNVIIVSLPNSNAAFSFFHYIVLGDEILETQRATILQHEMIHVKQKHSLDLLCFEVLKIFFWFNPLVYLYQKRITDLHEFIADEKTVALEGRQNYYQNLLSQVFDTKGMSFTNTFYKPSLIKNRLVMINKAKTNRILKLKYALLIPMIFGMLLYTSCEREDNEIQDEELAIIESLPFANLVYDSNAANNDEYYQLKKQKDEFLYNNPEFVEWHITNHKEKKEYYSIHHKNEEVPKGYGKAEITITDKVGPKTKVSYFKFIGDPPNAVYITKAKDE